MRRAFALAPILLLILPTFMMVLPIINATIEDEWMAIPPSYTEKYDSDDDGLQDSHKVQIDADTHHCNEVFTVHAVGRMYDRHDDTPLTPEVQVDWQISAPGCVNKLEWSPEMHFNVPDGYTPKEGYPYVRTVTFIYLYDNEWNLEQNGDYEYAPWEIRHNLYPPASPTCPVLSNGYVTPTEGDCGTLFEYYVDYYDADGDAPTQRDCVVDGAFHQMMLVDGSASDGTYRYVTKLDEGSHDFYFKFSDGQCTVHDPPGAPGTTYPGPTVHDGLSISIYLDKYSYSTGDTMYLGLDVANHCGETKVCLAIWVVRPGGSIYLYLHMHNQALPAEFIYSNPTFRTETLPDLPPGTYTWHAALLEPTTHTIIVEDMAEWQFS